MKKFLLLNIGNTHTQWLVTPQGAFDCLSSGKVATADWQQDLSLLPTVESDCAVWAACVVPPARKVLAESCVYADLSWIDALSAAVCGLDFSLVDTSTLGADRIANAAALLEYPLPAVNFDCGTAITMEIVDADKRFSGGAIMPGRKLMRQSLFKGTAALPEIPLSNEMPQHPGTNTLQAMTLGIDRGAVGMVREMLAVAQGQNQFTAVVSGGDAPFFQQAISGLTDGGKFFTLRGIYLIARQSAEKQ